MILRTVSQGSPCVPCTMSHGTRSLTFGMQIVLPSRQRLGPVKIVGPGGLGFS